MKNTVRRAYKLQGTILITKSMFISNIRSNVPEDSAVGTSVIRVVADDRDSGNNRIVTYAFQKVVINASLL